MKVFIDTSAFIAQLVKSETKHAIILKQLVHLTRQHALLFTSDFILDELYTRLNYDHGSLVTKKTMNLFRKVIDQQDLRIIKIDQKLFSSAEEILVKYSKTKLSFTDATTIAATKCFKIDQILTLDSDFKKVGMAVVEL